MITYILLGILILWNLALTFFVVINFKMHKIAYKCFREISDKTGIQL